MIRKAYHSQEHRYKVLKEPILCIDDDAWLGEGLYFWTNEEDALFWGNVKKRRTRKYDIYEAEIDCENILDTVFDEEEYNFWLKNVERAAKNILIKTGTKPTLKEINDFFKDRGIWNKLDGIMFQDISKNPIHYLVKEFQYKKRIQIALYNKTKLSKFALHYTGDCI